MNIPVKRLAELDAGSKFIQVVDDFALAPNGVFLYQKVVMTPTLESSSRVVYVVRCCSGNIYAFGCDLEVIPIAG